MIETLFDPYLVIAAASVVGLSIVSYALLRAWKGWLELKQLELDRMLENGPREIEGNASIGAARIEMADLKERIKKLEAIASGVEL